MNRAGRRLREGPWHQGEDRQRTEKDRTTNGNTRRTKTPPFHSRILGQIFGLLYIQAGFYSFISKTDLENGVGTFSQSRPNAPSPESLLRRVTPRKLRCRLL